jgi:myo-inositol-hexaphosphate 3-phosphohydrolase
LTPASTNEAQSQGYILYKVKLKPGFTIGDIIPNTASIYFDSNPAIVTNTFNTEFVQLLGNHAFDTDTISLFPNPTNNFVTITNNSAEKISKIAIYDVAGKQIYSVTNDSLNAINIDISHFAKGLYLVELSSDNNSKITKKLIIK